MKPEDVARSYDELAERWNSPHYDRENGLAAHRRAMEFARHRGAALDIGCGSSGRLIDLLLDAGFDVEGLDISPRMLELARKRHPDVTFHEADICQWVLKKPYDFITAWDSLWHIPLEEHERVLPKVLAALAPGGVCIFTTGGVDEPSDTTDAAMGPPMYHSASGLSRLLEIIIDSGCVCRHLEYDQYPELHVFIIAQKRE